MKYFSESKAFKPTSTQFIFLIILDQCIGADVKETTNGSNQQCLSKTYKTPKKPLVGLSSKSRLVWTR